MLPQLDVPPLEAQGTRNASAYRAAIDRTAQVIQRRARSFRNLVIVVVLIGIASLACALGTRSVSGLAGCLFMIPTCGAFFVIDARKLAEWRSALIASWTVRGLDLAAFRHAIQANPALPKPTLEAMLATLPSAGGIESEQRVHAATRRALAAHSDFVNHAHSDSLLVDTLASVVATAVVVAALMAARWAPLLGLTILFLRRPVGAMTRRRRRASRDVQVETCRRQPGFDEAQYAGLLATPR